MSCTEKLHRFYGNLNITQKKKNQIRQLTANKGDERGESPCTSKVRRKWEKTTKQQKIKNKNTALVPARLRWTTAHLLDDVLKIVHVSRSLYPARPRPETNAMYSNNKFTRIRKAKYIV